MHARHALVAWFALSLGFALACGNFKKEEPPPEPVLVETPPPVEEVWPVFQDQGSDFVKAGTAQGLVEEGPVTLLGPPIGDTTHREIVGAATVAKVWEDLARIERTRMKADFQGDLAARIRKPEDAAAIDALPEVKASSSRSGGATGTTAAEKQVVLPADLKDPNPDARMKALTRYESQPDATDLVVYVMKNDASTDVRKKAWRVVRARWRRGTGSRAEHETATIWLAAYGNTDMRLEALDALAELGSKLSNISRHLGDNVDKVRIKAAYAVVDYARRTGEQGTARSLLNDRLNKESDTKVRKDVMDALGKL